MMLIIEWLFDQFELERTAFTALTLFVIQNALLFLICTLGGVS